jgi:hypothetical protein
MGEAVGEKCGKAEESRQNEEGQNNPKADPVPLHYFAHVFLFCLNLSSSSPGERDCSNWMAKAEMRESS